MVVIADGVTEKRLDPLVSFFLVQFARFTRHQPLRRATCGTKSGKSRLRWPQFEKL
jgi:hypothetical protein